MAIDQAQEWLTDPAGRHRFRLFADGRPTEWVSDGNAITEDPLPPVEIRPAVASPGPTLDQPQAQAQPWAVGTRGDAEAAVPPDRPAGWYRNAAHPDEVRYWDGSAWTSPPADPSGGAGVSGTGAHTAAGGTQAPAAPVQAVPAPERPAPGGAAGAAAVPANWYPDPADRTRLRYWDGLGWTEQVLDERPAYP